jgi:hypothetical protein
MLLSLVYFLVRRLFGAGRRLQDEKDIELLVLRHQVKVLQRQVKRPRLHRLDRLLLAAASRAMPRGLWSSFVIRPETLLRWHRELVRWKWTYKRRARPGRPPIDPQVRDLILRLGRENPRWGYQPIRGELMKLGIRVSATTVRTILLRHGLDPAPRRGGPAWTEFLRSQASGISRSCSADDTWTGSFGATRSTTTPSPPPRSGSSNSSRSVRAAHLTRRATRSPDRYPRRPDPRIRRSDTRSARHPVLVTLLVTIAPFHCSSLPFMSVRGALQTGCDLHGELWWAAMNTSPDIESPYACGPAHERSRRRARGSRRRCGSSRR